MNKILSLSLITTMVMSSLMAADLTESLKKLDITTNTEIGIQSDKVIYNQSTMNNNASVFGKINLKKSVFFIDAEIGTLDSDKNTVHEIYGDYKVGIKNKIDAVDFSIAYRHLSNLNRIVDQDSNDSIVSQLGYTFEHSKGITRLGVRIDSIQTGNEYDSKANTITFGTDRRAINVTHHCNITDMDLFAEYAQIGVNDVESYEIKASKKITDTISAEVAYSTIDLDLDGKENILGFKLSKKF